MPQAMIYKVTIDGDTFEIPESVGTSTETMRAGLVGQYPWIDTAEFKVEVKDGVTTYEVVKKAGTLG